MTDAPRVDVHAELAYLAQHVTPDEFRVAALAEVERLQAEVERLRDTSPYFPCKCGRQVHVPALVDFVRLQEVEQRAEEVYAGGKPIPLASVSAGAPARIAIAKYILRGEQ